MEAEGLLITKTTTFGKLVMCQAHYILYPLNHHDNLCSGLAQKETEAQRTNDLLKVTQSTSKRNRVKTRQCAQSSTASMGMEGTDCDIPSVLYSVWAKEARAQQIRESIPGKEA